MKERVSKHPDTFGCRTLVLGLGNDILSDDGVGIHVAREIKKRITNKNLIIQEMRLGGLELLDPMIGFDRVILIDAMVTGEGDIGTLVRLESEALKGGSAMARHQVPFYEALQLGRKLNMNLPNEIIIYGIKVKDTNTFGESCTPEVEKCIPKIVDQIINNEFNTN